MARIRSIKPEFFKHLELQELENEYRGQYVMFIYAGLWTQCDKNGVFFYNAKVLKNEILPYIEFDMQISLDILEKRGYFIKFSANGRDYGFVQNFNKYQFPTKNEKDSPAKYPLPPKEILEGSQAQIEKFPSISENVPSNDTENHTEAEGLQDKGIRIKESDGSIEPQSLKDALILSSLLLDLHRQVIPDYLSGKDDKKIIERWAKDIEQLIRIDKKPPETIKQVIHYVKTPGCFWFPNIQSGKKLREKYETLYSQMLRQTSKVILPEKKTYIPDAEQTNQMLDEYKKDYLNAATGLSLSDGLKQVLREKRNKEVNV